MEILGFSKICKQWFPYTNDLPKLNIATNTDIKNLISTSYYVLFPSNTPEYELYLSC